MIGAGGATLKLKFHGRVIDHLGIQMYQSPVAAIAELVANSWDADAENVWIDLPSQLNGGATLVVRDDGLGMTFQECEDHYLNVGWNRRGDNPNERSPQKHRPVLGRKGIGKFAGFGIAEIIRVETISRATGERTAFELNIKDLRGQQYVSEGGNIPAECLGADSARKHKHGTTISLKTLKMSRRPSPVQFRKSMARRFLLHQQQAGFNVMVDETPLPDSLNLVGVEYAFPRDYQPDEKPATIEQVDSEGWGTEKLGDHTVRWRFLFLKDTIDEEELRGITIFARGKLAQSPFLFNLTGGLGGQHGVEYLSGQVQADFLDSLPSDLIATDRQRVDWENEASAPLLEWGQGRIKELLRLWRDRRAAEKISELEKKVAGFSARLEKLPSHESKTVKKALTKLAQIPTLSKQQFDELGQSVVTTWEQGRLKGLIEDISVVESLSEHKLLDVLLEAQVLTALNVAEAVKTKILTVGGLKLRIQRRELETAVRDFIAKNPWLISPEWETFRVENSLKNLTEELAKKAGLVGDEWAGRVDLVLSSGHHLLVIEFMRPGLKLNWDHVQRFERYVRNIKRAVEANTGGPFSFVTGYVVADAINQDADILDKIRSMRVEQMFALDWNTLFSKALAAWHEFLVILAARGPDERLQALLE